MVLDGAKVELSEEKQAKLKANGVKEQDITLGVRPEHISVAQSGDPNVIHGKVDVSEMMGSAVHLHVDACGKDTIVIVPTMNLDGSVRSSFATGTPVNFTFGGNVAHIFSKETEQNLEG